MTTRVAYLSPHLDDAALSCGGLIRRQISAGTNVVVITVFAGSPSRSELSPFAAELHAQWGHLSNPHAVRRREDKRAMRFLGADYRHLEYPDAIYRFNDTSFLYLGDEDLFASPHPSDRNLLRQVTNALAEIIHPQQSAIYAPLAVGNHVDHQLLRDAALTLHRRSYPVVFYEDYPYVEVPGSLTGVLECFGIERWTEEVQKLNEEDLAMKIEAIAAYASQMEKLFQGVAAMSERVRDYALAVSSKDGLGERYWRLSHAIKATARDKSM